MPITRRRLRASSSAPLLAVLPVVLVLLLLSLLLGGQALAQAPRDDSTATVTTTKDDGAKAPAADTTPLPDSITGGSGGATGPSSSGITGAIAKLVVGLAIVLGVIYGVYWLLRSAGKSKRAGGGDGGMTVVGTTVLSPGRSLHLVRVGDDLVLVGSAEQAVTRVHTWTGDEARRLDDSLTSPVDGLPAPGVGGAGGAGARVLDELRKRTVRG